MSEEEEKEPLRGDVMDVEGVAEYLGLSTSTIYDKVRDREMPHARLGNLLRFRKADIDRWLSENTLRPHITLQRRLAEAAERFFMERWLLSVGLDPEDFDPEEARQALNESLSRFSEADEF